MYIFPTLPKWFDKVVLESIYVFTARKVSTTTRHCTARAKSQRVSAKSRLTAKSPRRGQVRRRQTSQDLSSLRSEARTLVWSELANSILHAHFMPEFRDRSLSPL